MAEKSTRAELQRRTKEFALQTVCLCQSIPESEFANPLIQQLVRSGTSIGAHFRIASKPRSRADFITMLEFGIQGLSETLYWMELLNKSNAVTESEMKNLFDEGTELIAILVASIRAAKSKKS